MSKQINLFISSRLEEEPKEKRSYLKKLDKIIKRGKFVRVGGIEDFKKRYS